MLVCPTVRSIAEAVLATGQDLSPGQSARVEMLRLMPHYAAIKDLGAWEWSYKQPPVAEVENELDSLLDAVFEFGEYNLYCAFDPARTTCLYVELSDRLRRAGIDCPSPDEFTGL